MNKLKFTFKIKELELQVEGTREEVNTITNSIGQQFQGLIRPTGATGEQTSQPPLQITEDGEITEVKTPAKRRKNAGAQPKAEKAKAYDFKNDPSKYSSPLQSWTGLEKAVWLVYVVHNELSIMELSAGEIGETFNKHFKQQGKIRPSNIARDFGKQKAGAKAIVGENSTVSPTKWYLTEEGNKMAQKLIQNLKNGTE
jgi:hypothetical protein